MQHVPVTRITRSYSRSRLVNRTAMFLGLALLNLFVMPLHSYRVPGGIDFESWMPPLLGVISTVICIRGIGASCVGERIARLVCIGACLLEIAIFISFWFDAQSAIFHAYHG